MGRRSISPGPRTTWGTSTGAPDITLPADWDSIPGARGCTPPSCAFRDSVQDFQDRGFDLVGLSAQDAAEQAEFATREHIPYPLVSDAALTLQEYPGLPVFEAASMTLYKGVTLVVRASQMKDISSRPSNRCRAPSSRDHPGATA